MYIRAILILTISVMQGCGLSLAQRSAINEFSSAGMKVSEYSSEKFQEIPKQITEITQKRYKSAHFLTCGGERNSCDVSLDGGLSFHDIDSRLKAIAGLREYSEALNRIANANNREELSEASSHLVSSYQELSQGAEASGNDEIEEAIAIAISSGIDLFIQENKKELLSKIVSRYQPTIEKVVYLLITDFGLSNYSDCYKYKVGDDIDESIVTDSSKKSGLLDKYCDEAGKASRESSKVLRLTKDISYKNFEDYLERRRYEQEEKITDPIGLSKQARELIATEAELQSLRNAAVDSYFHSERALREGYQISRDAVISLRSFATAHSELMIALNDSGYSFEDFIEFSKRTKEIRDNISE